jgi:hypothetical protein
MERQTARQRMDVGAAVGREVAMGVEGGRDRVAGGVVPGKKRQRPQGLIGVGCSANPSR